MWLGLRLDSEGRCPLNPGVFMNLQTASAPAPLEEKLSALISERILETGAGFSADSDLYAAGLDSMAIMQLLLVLEEEFSVSIPVESVSRKNFSTVRTIADLLRTKLGHIPAELADVGPLEMPTAPAFPEPVAESIPRTEERQMRFEKLPMRGCDYFVLGFDTLSRKAGQGGHRAHSILVLDHVPDVAKLRALLAKAAEYYPMLSAKLKRNFLFGIPYWVPSEQPVVPELRLFSEEGSAGKLLALGGQNCKDIHSKMEEVINDPMPKSGRKAWPKARFTLFEGRDGTATLMFSWSHLMMDGVGAETFLQDLQRLGSDSTCEPLPQVDPVSEDEYSPLKERWNTARPIVQFFRKLSEHSISCLGSAKPKKGTTRFLIHTLTEEQTRVANARCASLCGGLINMPFYLACSMRAHDRVFQQRGIEPPSHTCNVPVQRRKKGARGPIFQNHLTMFFGVLERAQMATIESATTSLLEQQARFLKERLGESLDDLMHTMSVIPAGLYMRFVQMQMRGPFASFFHSHTGEFAAGMNEFLSAKVVNAYHVPGIATPPGTGIFCNEKNGRLVVTMCWHDGAVTKAERRLMIEQFLTDLGVA